MAGARKVIAVTIVAVLCTSTAALGQSVQYKSPAGVEYRAQADTGPIARA